VTTGKLKQDVMSCEYNVKIGSTDLEEMEDKIGQNPIQDHTE